MNRLNVLIGVMFLFFSAVATENEQEVSKTNLSISVDGFSKHQWRGFFAGNTPTLEPSATFSFNNLSLGIWAATTYDASYQEVDLYAIYSYKGLSIGLFNYFDPAGKFFEANYLEFKKGKTEHLYSIDVSYTMPVIAPVKFSISTLLRGADVTKDGNFAYSTYVESAYAHHWGDFSLKGAVGCAVNKSIYNGYSKDFSLVNTLVQAKYNFTINNKYGLPVHATMIYNPYSDEFVVSYGFSFSFSKNL